MPYRFLLLALVIFLGSCNTEQPVTKEEAALLAKKITVTINNGDPSVLDSLLDAEAMASKFKKTTKTGTFSPIAKELKSTLAQMKLGSQIVRSLDSIGFYHLVKQYEKEGTQHLVFGLYGSAGINYHDFELVKLGQEVKAKDVYIYLVGQTVVDAMTESAATTTTEGMETGTVTQATKNVHRIRELMNAGKNEEAKNLFYQLPAPYRKIKSARKMEVMVLYANGDMEEYNQASARYTRDFPSGPDIYFTMISTAFEKQDYDLALKAVNKLDSFLDKDPFLDYYRGLIYKVKQNADSAKYYFASTMKNYPDFADGYVEMALQYAAVDNKEEAATVVQAYRHSKKYEQRKIAALVTMYPYLEQ